MSYCRFRNTKADLIDCRDNLDHDIDDPEEAAARVALVKICAQIVAKAKGEDWEAV